MPIQIKAVRKRRPMKGKEEGQKKGKMGVGARTTNQPAC